MVGGVCGRVTVVGRYGYGTRLKLRGICDAPPV